MIEFDCEEVKRQLNRLAETYPDDSVDIWICWREKKLVYTTYLSSREPYECGSGHGDTVTQAVDDLIAKAGVRNREATIRAKRLAIDKARAELTKLEGELDPLVAEMDRVKAQIEKQST